MPRKKEVLLVEKEAPIDDELDIDTCYHQRRAPDLNPDDLRKVSWTPASIKRRKSCMRCDGFCCRNVWVVLAPYEVAQVLEGTYHLEAENVGPNYWVIATDSDKWCRYIDRETKRCTVYDKRPEACKRWYCGRGGKYHKAYLAMRVGRWGNGTTA